MHFKAAATPWHAMARGNRIATYVFGFRNVWDLGLEFGLTHGHAVASSMNPGLQHSSRPSCKHCNDKTLRHCVAFECLRQRAGIVWTRQHGDAMLHHRASGDNVASCSTFVHLYATGNTLQSCSAFVHKANGVCMCVCAGRPPKLDIFYGVSGQLCEQLSQECGQQIDWGQQQWRLGTHVRLHCKPQFLT